MVDQQLKPIRNLRSKSDVRSFSHIRTLDTSEFFPSCWIGMMDILLLQKQYEVLLEVFIKSIYFFTQSNSLEFEQKHSKTIKKFSYFIEKQDHSRIKEMLFEDEIWFLLKDIEDWIPYDEESFLAPLHQLLKFIQVGFIEKADGFDDICWNNDSPLLVLHLFQTDEQIFLLYPKDRLKIESIAKAEEEEESPLLVDCDEAISPQGEDTQVSSFEDSFEENDEEWLETVKILNKEKEPLFKYEGKGTGLEEILEDLNSKEKDEVKNCIFIDRTSFLKSFIVNLIDLLIHQDLFHLAFSVFFNTIYHFPQSRVLEFEKNFLEFIKDFSKALNQSQKEESLSHLRSEIMQNMMNQVESFAENSRKADSSLIRPLFPLFRSSLITLVEKTPEDEYIWKTKKTLITVKLYENKGDLYLLVPKNGFQAKKLETQDEPLKTENDFLVLNIEPSDILVLDPQDNDLVENDELDSSIRINQENHSPQPASPTKVITFSPMLEIEISSPSTPRNKDFSQVQNSILTSSKSKKPDPIENLEKSESIISNFSASKSSKPPRAASSKASSMINQITEKTKKTEKKVEKSGFQLISSSEIIKTRVIHQSVFSFQDSSNFKDSPMESKQKTPEVSKRKNLSYDGGSLKAPRPSLPCGSFICLPCSRDLIRSSDFLTFQPNKTSESFMKKGPSQSSQSSLCSFCAFCSSSLSKKFKVLCSSCFISSSLNSSPICSSSGPLQWLNIHQEQKDESSPCNFCNFITLNAFLLKLCRNCEELACFSCIRRNDYLLTGSCGSCRSKRIASPMLINDN